MSLKDQLAALKTQNIAKHPTEAVNLVLGDIKRLNESGIAEGAPKAGEKLKDFTLPNQVGATRSLAQFRKNGPVVVTFSAAAGAVSAKKNNPNTGE